MGDPFRNGPEADADVGPFGNETALQPGPIIEIPGLHERSRWFAVRISLAALIPARELVQRPCGGVYRLALAIDAHPAGCGLADEVAAIVDRQSARRLVDDDFRQVRAAGAGQHDVPFEKAGKRLPPNDDPAVFDADRRV